MKTVLLDDDLFALGYLKKLCFQIPEIIVIATFTSPTELLSYLALNDVDLVITDIEMPCLSGLDTVAQLRRLCPEIIVIFVTGHEHYALQAFQMEVAAYLLKPCGLEALRKAIHRALLLSRPKKSVTLRTFGHFSVLIGDTPVHFSNKKAKELLALLVDRNGAVVSMEAAIDVLWEDRTYDEAVKRLYRKAVGYLYQIFAGTDFFISERGSCHINPARANCDYFQFLRNPTGAEGQYHGEYLMDYSWAETTNGRITHLINKYGEF